MEFLICIELVCFRTRANMQFSFSSVDFQSGIKTDYFQIEKNKAGFQALGITLLF